MERILIVEDDQMLAEGIKMTLNRAGYDAEISGNLRNAKENLFSQQYDLIILDINLPDGDGLQFLKKYRSKISIPVLFLTARDTEEDEIAGFEAGGDDYVTKPFSIAVLRARTQSLLRRQEKKKQVAYNHLNFDFSARQFYIDNKEIILSKAEQEVLELLATHPGRTFSRDQIIENVWKQEESVDGNTLSVTMKRLRAKLGVDHIKTVYGIGYRWEKESTSC